MHPLPGSNENVHPFFRAINAIQRVREDDTPCEIEKGLYLGSLRAANNKSALISYNVTHILTVAGHLPPSYPRDFVYKCITISDREDENISQYFDECFNFIEEAKRRGGVLVHCFAGRSRSASILVAYLMKKHGMSLQQAMEHVRLKRPVASPNSGFMSQLRVFEMTLRDSEKRNAKGLFGEYSHKPCFINRFPVALTIELVLARLENNYYRSLEALKHDIKGRILQMRQVSNAIDDAENMFSFWELLEAPGFMNLEF